MSFETIAKTLNMDFDLDEIREDNVPMVIPEDEVKMASDPDEDVEYAAAAVKTTMEKLTSVFDELHNLATASESTKAYEALNGIASTVNNLASNLARIRQGRQGRSAEVSNVTTNNTLICSPSDIIRRLNEKDK